MTAPITPDERAAMRERYTGDLPSSWTAQGAWRRAILDRGQHAGADVPRLLDALDTAEAEVENLRTTVREDERHLRAAEAKIERQRERLSKRQEQVKRLRSEVTRLHAEVARLRAEAWDEGYTVGYVDATDDRDPDESPNPYREEADRD